MDMKRLARWTVPVGAMEIADYAERFRKLGLPATWCFDKARKHALHRAHIELIPPAVRRDPAVAIDVGANAGSWSLAVLEMLPVTRLLAFEPQPHVFAEMKARLAPFPKAQCFEVGLGDREATLTMHVHGSHDLSSFLPLRDDVRNLYHLPSEAPREVTVPVRTLDSFTEDVARVGVLKLDVQGFEPQVVAGGEKTLAKTDCVMIEVNYRSHYEGDSSFDGTHRLLADRGFRVWGISAPYLSDDGEPLWADAVYVRKR